MPLGNPPMATLLVTDCPRCGARRITFDVTSDTPIAREFLDRAEYEAFGVCRECKTATVFVLRANPAYKSQTVQPSQHVYAFTLVRPVTPADLATAPPPEQLPKPIDRAFREAAKCAAVGCHNAAGTMFRLCLDLAAKGHNAAGGTLFKRLQWLCDEKQFAPGLRDLAAVVRQDGNDGAHDGTLDKDSVEDMAAFADRFLTQCSRPPRSDHFSILVDAPR